MRKEDLKGKRVTVFGLGVNEGGVGTVEFLERSGVRDIIVTDMKRRDRLSPSLNRLSRYGNITYVLGQHRPEDFSRTDLVVKNPAIPWTNEYVRLAESKGIPVEMDSGIFFENCPNPIIGVTGTKGKTTTSSMIVHIFQESGRGVVPVGIGRAPVLGALDGIRANDTVVFELSSWRLSALRRLRRSPDVAVFTNFFPDHLDHYRSMSDYLSDKKALYEFQKKSGIRIVDATLGFADDQNVPSERIPFSATGGPFESGSFFSGDEAFIVRGGKRTALFRKPDLRIPGDHVLAAALPAASAAFVSGIPSEKIAAALRTFRGLPHRLELVAEYRGVMFYNDSAATVPEAAVSALRSFDRPMIIIAGGSDKRLDFGPLAEEILRKAKGVVFFEGSGTERLLREIRSRLPESEKEHRFETVSDMGKAVELAYRSAEPGDIVLLSPGAASFGLFQNEFDRGEKFQEAVRNGVMKKNGKNHSSLI